MNPDEPKLTAYALDELDPAERAEIEQLLRDDTAARAEVEQVKSFTVKLREQLKAEAGAPLTEVQRTSILAASTEGAAARAPKVVAFPMRRVIVWAAAACLFVGVGVALLFPTVEVLKEQARGTHAQVAAIPSVQDGKDYVGFAPSAEPALAANSPVPGDTLAYAPPQIPQQLHLADAKPAAPPALSEPSLQTGATSPAGPTARAGDLSLSVGEAAAANLSNPGSGTLVPNTSATRTMAGVVVENEGRLARTDAYGIMPAATPIPASALAKPASLTLAKSLEGRSNLSLATGTKAGAAPVASLPMEVTLKSNAAGAKDLGDIADKSKLVDRAENKEVDEISTLRRSGGFDTESYDAITDNAFLAVRENPLSTFSIDVDTASYANVRRFLNQQSRPPKGAVRIEELLNYFDYNYPQPDGDAPFSATMEVATCPWAPEHRLVRVALKGREIKEDKRPASNLVFLIDVSGSMQPANKLPLLKKCLAMLVDRLSPEDTVSIAVYAGASGCVLEPTHSKREIRAALDRLESGGSTNGAAGIQLAYRLAEQSFIKGGVNRVILATDGDFNVGVTSQSDLVDLIERKAKSGVFLTVLGFGMDNLKDSTLEKLADKGNGNYAYIDTLNEGRKVLVEQMNGTLVTIAKDVKIQVEFNPAQAAAYRLIGYENRLLAKEDFNDDKKDAGEIGAGHTVTALYEVVPAGKTVPGTPAVDALKYQREEKSEVGRNERSEAGPATRKSEVAELLTLKLRYKQPDGDTSKLLEFPLTDRGETWEKSSRDFRFAAAVAGFGMLLRESPHKGSATWSSVRELAMEGRGDDRSGYRGEFLTLIDKAKVLAR